MYEKSIGILLDKILVEIRYYLSRKYSGLTDNGINNIIGNDIITTDINCILCLLQNLQSDVEKVISFYYERENIE